MVLRRARETGAKRRGARLTAYIIISVTRRCVPAAGHDESAMELTLLQTDSKI